jgi:hypothetical protein
VGISSTSANIAKIEIQVLQGTNLPNAAFAIDKLELNNPEVAAVPEPASWALALAGIGIVAGGASRRHRAG